MKILPPFACLLIALAALSLGAAGAAHAQEVVYRCPGNNFTNSISAKTAEQRGCKPIEGGRVTIIHGTRPAASATAARKPAALGAPTAAASGQPDRVASTEQKARDSDARRILETELRTEQEKLSALLKEYNDGQPERRGDERNAQRYMDRIAELKTSISRTEGNIAALKRELSKLASL